MTSPEVRNSSGMSPFQTYSLQMAEIACQIGHFELAKLLMARGDQLPEELLKPRFKAKLQTSTVKSARSVASMST